MYTGTEDLAHQWTALLSLGLHQNCSNSAIKRNEIELFVVRWMDLESVIQSEVRKRKANNRMLRHIYGI